MHNLHIIRSKQLTELSSCFENSQDHFQVTSASEQSTHSSQMSAALLKLS